ncbi:hypothetical protein DB88DRAFT_443137, partial [Papiliotrema laurentii]
LTTRACGFCRRRKLKCTGERPKCSSCIKYSKECEYAPPPKAAKYKALETTESVAFVPDGDSIPVSMLRYAPPVPDTRSSISSNNTGSLSNGPNPRQASISRSSPSSSSSTPDAMIGLPLNATVDSKSPNPYGRPLPHHGLLNGSTNLNGDQGVNGPDAASNVTVDPVDSISQTLGEFLFTPKTVIEGIPPSPTAQSMASKKQRTRTDTGGSDIPLNKTLIPMESDGLTDAVRESLLDCFLAHSRLFLEMSIPRFRYRMTFTDKRRPAPALLYAMYLWATRMTNSPKVSPMEQHFFEASCRALDVSSSNADRLIDCMRAAMLLSCYSYSSGRYHEGWILCGMAVRMILSTGLHQIRSCVYAPEPPRDPFLRGKTVDADRSWSILAVERTGALATGFPCGIADADIITPFPRAFGDIASRSVTQHDDLTIRDLYRHTYFEQDDEHPLSGRWMKAVVILERASKLAFIDPEEDSEYARAWSTYFMQSPHNPRLSNPPAWLDQPKYRCPKDYSETKLALDQLQSHMGVDGIFPVDRRRNAQIDGADEPAITPHTIKLHHQFAATHIFLHDINAPGVENKEALAGARRSVSLMRHLPPLDYADTDSFCVTVWSMIAKTLIKELRRLYLLKDAPGELAVAT